MFPIWSAAAGSGWAACLTGRKISANLGAESGNSVVWSVGR